MFQDLRKPNFTRLRNALLCKQPDTVPLIELGIHPVIKKEIMGKPVVSVTEEIEFMSSMGYDFIKLQPSIQFTLNRKQAESLKKNQKSTTVSVDRAWASEHEGVIKDWKDFEEYPWPKISDISYSRLEEAKNILPEGMQVIGQYGDIFTLVWEMMGFEKFALAVYEEPELVKALFDKIGPLIFSMYETMAEMEWVGALWYSDDIAYSTALFYKPDFFREYLFPYMKKMGDLAKKRNIPFIYHSDGVLFNVLDDFIQCGITSLHPIEPKAMDICELKQKVQGKLALCGNIDVDLLSRGTTQEVRDLVKKRISEVAPGGGYCLGSSNSIPDYVKTENFLEMVKACIEYGNY